MAVEKVRGILEKSIDKNAEICYYFLADMPKRSAPMRV